VNSFQRAFDAGFREELHKQAKFKLPKLFGKKSLLSRPLGLLAALRGKPRKKK